MNRILPSALAAALLCAASVPLLAQTPAPAAAAKSAAAVRVQGRAPVVDGRLDDDAWSAAPVIDDFVQKQPVEGGAPTEGTEVRFVYDDHALYVGARMYKQDPAAVQAPVSRRDDGGQAEHVWISLDTYQDRRTAYSFGVTAAGTRMDWYHPRDHETDIDLSFDPVWHAEVRRDSLGWTAEMRIPFSQLRFNARDVQTWGLNIDRWNPATQEDVFWIPVPSQEQGWASRMGTLSGIRGIRPSRRMELLPYVAGSGAFTAEPGAGNPFDDGSTFDARAGADLKMGLGPNLTLEATVNPDFGQVELDPAEVNLSAYETYFSERRPFFIEGSQLLAGSGPEYFYSRRIGGIPDAAGLVGTAGAFEDRPRNSTILGAGKLTGRLPTGTSVGALAAVTDDAFARGFDPVSATFDRIRVAPTTAYGVGRAQQEFGADQSTAGVTLTAVRRDLEAGSALESLLHREAYAGGADWNLRFRGGEYSVSGHAGFSHVAGDSLALLRTQRSSARYFQRPDADHVAVDSSATSLSGYAARLAVSRNSGRHWLWTTSLSTESPGFEVNDAGFQGRADRVFGYGNLRWRETRPGRLFQRYEVGVSTENAWNQAGDRVFAALRTDMTFTWRNFWRTTVIAWVDLPSQSDVQTRGGPVMETPTAWRSLVSISSPGSRRTSGQVQVTRGGGAEGHHYQLFYVRGSFRPGPRWQFSIEPLWRRLVDPRQYVTTLPEGPAETYGRGYAFARVDQTVFSAATRLNYLFRPDLSLEVYAEPFAASGRYTEFGTLERPRTYALDPLGDRMVSEDGEHFLLAGEDADGDGREDRRLIARDFNVRSFRSNAVLRWEWRPGSTLYLVWQQDRASSEVGGEHVGFRALGETFAARGDNTLAVKMTYWIPVR